MTSHSLRVRLALALGLPACGPATPPTTTPPTNTGVAASPSKPPNCGNDEVLEDLCGRVTVDHDTKLVGAPPPHDKCPLEATDLDSFDGNGVMDGWRHSEHDPIYAHMTYSAKRTAEWTNNSGVAEGEPRCCYERCTPLPAIAEARKKAPAGMHEYDECWPKPVKASHPAPGGSGCPVALHTRIWYPDGVQDPLDDAPFVRATDGNPNYCCYSVASLHPCPPNTFQTANGCEEPNPGGRPLREAGEVVLAPARARDGWSRPARVPELPAATRAYAAARWAREAAFEHASVAAFARLSLELMAHGAPSELVEAAHDAARDEIRHARIAYGIAAAFGDATVGPGPLPLATTQIGTLEELAVECFRDGCVGETVAALCVAEAARRSSMEVLAEIADDEARHAELSYRILAWALREQPWLRARIAQELAALRTDDAPASDHDDRTGLLSARDSAAMRRRVIADVVVPCTTALLA